jgi:hypothetical protein
MELDSTTRKFNSNFRRKIVLKISKLKEKKDLVNVFNIIQNELGKELSINRNGIFFNINLLSDMTILELEKYFCENTDCNTITETETKIQYKPYSVDDLEQVSKLGPKLSNQEKSILKKITKI